MSFFIVMTHNFPVNFKFIYFQLWTKESHQGPNFEIFKCSGENLPNCSCYFPSHKSVFLQILHHSLVSWKITPLYVFRSNIIFTFHGRDESKCTFFRLLIGQIKIYQILISFETTNHFSFKFCINFQYYETQLLCTFLAEILYTFNKKKPIKVQVWWNRKSKIWHFDGLLLSK